MAVEFVNQIGFDLNPRNTGIIMANSKNQRKPGTAAGHPRISDAEWVVMNALWRRAPMTANQVVAALARETDWKPKTIHTLLRRLVQKKAVHFEKTGREHRFHPTLDAQDCRREESRTFLRKLFDGRPAPFLACLLEEENFGAEEIAELKRLLDDYQP